MTMTERVARAIADASCEDYDGRLHNPKARAAIAAMSVPTAVMIEAGMAAIPMTVDPIDPRDLVDAYQAMVEAAQFLDGYEA